MNCKIKILLLLMVFVSLQTHSQINDKQEELTLFTDRDFCISGDTLWFKVWLPNSMQQKGNVVRIQLYGKSNNLISSVIKMAANGWADGFINVPDSLSTGQYFVTAYINSQRNLSDIAIKSKSLLVYNRFEERVSEIEIVKTETLENDILGNGGVKLETDQEKYQTRDKVTINFNSEVDFKNVIVKASIVDPLAKEVSANYKFNLKSSNIQIPDFKEQDGFLISGRVVDVNRNPQPEVLVILSITDEPPHFDYYLSGKEGDFHFFLKNAVGRTNIVLQAISSGNNEFFIEKELNYLEIESEIIVQTKVLSYNQSEFISLLIKGNFIDKLFNPVNLEQPDFFEMPARFTTPFYGLPSYRVLPKEFLELPDFNEISKELLKGVQYRNRNGNITIRMVNEDENSFFYTEPLRLLNGIPIFKNSLFANLKSEDISYIDITKKERIFGNLSFKGVLAVSLFDKSNSWMAEQANIFQFNINCLQPDNYTDYSSRHETDINTPDLRQIYCWKALEIDSINEIEFFLSDLKGEVEISLEGITTNDEVFRVTKTIEVK
ncbi:MAG: hypothetical protein GQ525_09785 [Draconibacterium sp.]|nr:hypothetical protein [Draconibacterium sp.]